MATYIVRKVRVEAAPDGRHEHIEGVCTSTGAHYTRKEVVDSLRAGNVWKTSAGDYEAMIQAVNYCPQAACMASPYITTNATSAQLDNLENLPRC